MLIPCLLLAFLGAAAGGAIPLVINTWGFVNATHEAWNMIRYVDGATAVDAVVTGCATCQTLQCDTTVGYGGSPDEVAETTQDAMIFNGLTMDMGAVGGLRFIKDAIQVARHVMDNTEHSILVGDLATKFARDFVGLKQETLTTNYSIEQWRHWIQDDNCQPNFWKNVHPDPKETCGPYQPLSANSVPAGRHFGHAEASKFGRHNHDTIGMIAIDANNLIVAGTSSNGANHKIPGRIGDAPIPGAGAYADNEVGAAVATGDGDVMMRFLPSFLAVEEMRHGATPAKAAQTAIARIARKYPTFSGAVIAVSSKGEFAAACNGMEYFPFSVASDDVGSDVDVRTVVCRA